MPRIVPIAMSIALCALAMLTASAQQLHQPATPAQPVVQDRDSGVGPRLKAAQSTPPVIPADPGQRPPATAPIPSTGPSVPRPVRTPVEPIEPDRRDAPRQVLDEKGRLVPGAVQVSPTRAYEPATGRYFQTMPRPEPPC